MFSFLLFIYKANICISEDVHTHVHTHRELDFLMALLQSNFIIVPFHIKLEGCLLEIFLHNVSQLCFVYGSLEDMTFPEYLIQFFPLIICPFSLFIFNFA